MESRIPVHSVAEQLEEIKRRSPGWRLGAPLHALTVSDTSLPPLARSTGQALRAGLGALEPPEVAALGAALVLLGSRLFKGRPVSDYSYDALWSHEQMGGRPTTMGHALHDAMEHGARQIWGLQVLGPLGYRRFLGTFFLHGGDAWPATEALAHEVSRRWSWISLSAGCLDGACSWLERVRRDPELSPEVREVISGPEGRAAVGRGLLTLAEGRDLLWRHGWLTPSAEDTLRRVDAAGLELAMLLGAPDAASARRALDALLPPVDAHGDLDWGPALRWLDRPEGAGRLGVQLPSSLPAEALPPEVEAVEITLAGGGASATYTRVGRLLVHRRGPRWLGLDATPGLPALVLMRWSSGAGLHEAPLNPLELPAWPVAVFDTSTGWPSVAPAPGQRVALVCDRDVHLAPPQGFVSHRQGGLDVLVGVWHPPTSPMAVETQGEVGTWQPAEVGRPGILLLGHRVPDLWFGGRPCYDHWPTAWLVGGAMEGTWTLIGPDGTVRARERLSAPAGRLGVVPPVPEPGGWEVHLETGVDRRVARFVLLPAGATPRVVALPEGVQPSLSADGVELRRPGGEVLARSAVLDDAAGLELKVTAPWGAGLEAGRWSPRVAPASAVADAEGLTLRGRAGALVNVEAAFRVARLCLDGAGERRVPWGDLPEASPANGGVRVRFDGGAEVRLDGAGAPGGPVEREVDPDLLVAWLRGGAIGGGGLDGGGLEVLGLSLLEGLTDTVARLSPGECVRWVNGVAELRAGLLSAAVRLWGPHLPWEGPAGEGLELVLGPLRGCERGVAPLTADERRLLERPELAWTTGRYPLPRRLLGLCQARARAEHFGRSPGLRRLMSGGRKAPFERWAQEGRLPTGAPGLEERLWPVEELVVDAAWAVARARRGELVVAPLLPRLRRLREVVPALLDFWIDVVWAWEGEGRRRTLKR